MVGSREALHSCTGVDSGLYIGVGHLSRDGHPGTQADDDSAIGRVMALEITEWWHTWWHQRWSMFGW